MALWTHDSVDLLSADNTGLLISAVIIAFSYINLVHVNIMTNIVV